MDTWFTLLFTVLLCSEPYCGSNNDLQETRLGQGPDVVLSLIDKFKLKKGSTVTMDNLFTPASLLDKLTELGIYMKIYCKVYH